MKKLNLLMVLFLLITASCSDEKNFEEIINSATLTFPTTENINPILPKEGGEISISFTALSKWVVDVVKTGTRLTEEVEDWITVTPRQGGPGKSTLTIKILTSNNTYSERSAIINITCGETIKGIKVTQQGRSEKDDFEEILKSEREALIAFYKMTNGDGWKNNSGWCSEKPISSWYGVSTDEKGRVTYIDLGRNNLIGRLPENIGNLKKLRYLRINDNYLYGELPESFYDLTELECFNAGNHNFGAEGGTIVIDPSNPEAPTLGRNQLSGEISEKIGNLKNLREFSILQNCFTGELPKTIWTLTNLQVLLLTHNHNLETDEYLCGELPEEIGNLKNLRQLWLSGNKFSGKLPESIVTLANLEELIISYNAFTEELPKDFGNLKRLKQLDLAYNLFTGELPESFYDLSALKEADLRGIPSNGVKVVWADGIYVVENSNKFTGEISKKIKDLKRLVGFDISYNDFIGCIPEEVLEIQGLEMFNINGNRISGTITKKMTEAKWYNPEFILYQQEGYGFTFEE